MFRLNWKWRARSFVKLTERIRPRDLLPLRRPRSGAQATKSPEARLFLYDFFMNCLPHFYGETCLIHDGTSRQLVLGGRRISARMRTAGLAILVKF